MPMKLMRFPKEHYHVIVDKGLGDIPDQIVIGYKAALALFYITIGQIVHMTGKTPHSIDRQLAWFAGDQKIYVRTCVDTCLQLKVSQNDLIAEENGYKPDAIAVEHATEENDDDLFDIGYFGGRKTGLKWPKTQTK